MIVVFVLDHLRRHVLERAAEGIPLLHVVELDTPAEIANLDDVAVLNQYVLRLDVAMDQSLLVQIVDTAANLDEEVEGRVLREELGLADEVEQITFARILQREVDGGLVTEARVEPADVLVVQLLLDSNLPNQRFFDFAGRQGGFFDLLDGDEDACGLVLGELDLAVRAFAKLSFFRVEELEVGLLKVLQEIVDTALVWCQAALVVCFFDEGRRRLDSFDVAQEH